MFPPEAERCRLLVAGSPLGLATVAPGTGNPSSVPCRPSSRVRDPVPTLPIVVASATVR